MRVQYMHGTEDGRHAEGGRDSNRLRSQGNHSGPAGAGEAADGEPSMIHIVLGTRAQLVKMAPVMARLRDRGEPYRLIHTGQHHASMDEMLVEFELKRPDVVLYSGPDVVSLPQMAFWGVRILFRCLTGRRVIFGDHRRGIVLVHGDTVSTLLGALMGRVAGLTVGHVESGLRSFRLFHPFPEEITRLLTFRLSHVLFCPGEWAMGTSRSSGVRRSTLAPTPWVTRSLWRSPPSDRESMCPVAPMGS